MIIRHSTGNMKVTLPFESGPRIIRYISETNTTSIKELAQYPIMDLPMLQEDALYLLKFILNDSSLKDKTVTFVEGTKVNHQSTWKNTGFWFVLSCDDMEALEDAVKSIKNSVYWLNEINCTK